MNCPMVDIHHFDYSIIREAAKLARPRGNQGKKKKVYYKNMVCAFDIETTNDPEIEASYMYVWQFQVDEIVTVFGRTWDQFREFVDRVHAVAGNLQLVTFVHNLSFEMSFLKGEFHFEPEDVFCTDYRKVLKATLNNTLELRCSYLQSGYSLDELCKRWGKTRKQSGKKYKYNRIRYPWTRLNRRERKYIQADVLGLVQAMKARLEYSHDTLYTLPLTKTGYVRRDAKREMKKYNHYQLMDTIPGPDVMKMLLEAFRGGNTHTNRYYSGEILPGVESEDMNSAYPGSEIMELYPMGSWYVYTDPRNLNYKRLKKFRSYGQAIVFRAGFRKIRMADRFHGCPYISRHKCRNAWNVLNDNGRVLAADYIETTLTDIDLEIIESMYIWDDIEILSMASSAYKPLPVFLLDLIRGYYQMKTLLKGGDPIDYQNAKENLNSIYGMSVQNPVKPLIQMIDGLFELESDYDFIAEVEKHKKKAFQSYAWGVWITCHTRKMLQRAIDAAGDYFVYCDTDSVKTIGKLDLSALNEEIKTSAIKNNAAAEDAKGNVHYLRMWEHDASYNRFISWGAKKYAYEDDTGLHLTVAGVNKKEGAEELRKAGGLEAFKPGFVFRKAGGNAAKYNDNQELTIYREGHTMKVRDNLYIYPSEYTLGITAEYEEILTNPAAWLEIDNIIKNM